MKIALFVNDSFGEKITDIFRKNATPIEYLIFNDKSSPEYKEKIKSQAQYTHSYDYQDFLNHTRGETSHLFDLGILCWWPYIVKRNVIDLARLGLLNFHPSYLPYGRGKHTTFWTFVDGGPFGATIHWVNDAIDNGEIAFQEKIDKTWEDNAQSLYGKARDLLLEMFEKNFKKVCMGEVPRFLQGNEGKLRYAKEIQGSSRIDLDKTYTGRELLNLLRARTFEGYPSCWFEDDGKIYDVRVSIEPHEKS